ncbi:unnamed protein product [Meganyctiphanes norvegica]|uniref:Zinc finger PHD-type domain-containing protein n=1 Tax=Meganyctiphanes norvegica TaxID=48144 RepID=A0AAV2PLX4_MEGNR
MEPTIKLTNFNSGKHEEASLSVETQASVNDMQPDNILTYENEVDASIDGNKSKHLQPQESTSIVSAAIPDQNNGQHNRILIAEDETDKSIDGYKPVYLESKKSPTGGQTASPEENYCIFCLGGGDLIHICSCSVISHKECALEYIRFPGSMNDCCCQCRAVRSWSLTLLT